jgi:hypothetical protein
VPARVRQRERARDQRRVELEPIDPLIAQPDLRRDERRDLVLIDLLGPPTRVGQVEARDDLDRRELSTPVAAARFAREPRSLRALARASTMRRCSSRTSPCFCNTSST